MAKHSRRMQHFREQIAELGSVDLTTAVSKLKELHENPPSGVKAVQFDQSVEMAFRLGVDPKQADQVVRGSLVLPHGIGKSQRVLVFAKDDNAAAAEAAGADFVGGKDLADKIVGGWLDFDVAIATPDMMGVVGPLGRVLGPRGMMPSPRAGTVTQDVATAVSEYKAGKVEFRVDKAGNVHAICGKLSFSAQQLSENAEALLKYVNGLKPSSTKGVYMKHVTVSATMMPGITVAV